MWTIPIPSLTNKEHFVVFFFFHEHNECFFASIEGGFTVHHLFIFLLKLKGTNFKKLS